MALLFGFDGFDRMVRKLIDAFCWVFTQLDWEPMLCFTTYTLDKLGG
ncbi:MAG: hypothetical protein KME57_28490 [Scytonema hyalinum WJT4-NPBG1]|nr:hypothetical protein [Scytonema hyalinum WJT4-NPBG1]